MKEKIIPNTQKRYSITSEGIIYTHYKNTNTGKKCYRKVPLAKYLQKNSAVVNLQFGKHSKANRSKTIYVNTLMIDMFKLKKPDIFHMYDLKPKNGDILDNSLNNLEWRIRSTSDFNFYPQPYYDKKGNITSKRCSNCGEIKDISYYSLQTPKRKSENPTYKNKCTRCRTTERRILINSSEESLKRAREHARRWSNSEKGKAYHRQYGIAWTKKDYDRIGDHYISNCLKVPRKELTPELREIFKKKITLKRKLENHGKEN